MTRMAMALLLCLHLSSLCFGHYHIHMVFLTKKHPSFFLYRTQIATEMLSPAISPANPPVIHSTSPQGPRHTPALAPDYHGPARSPTLKHHRGKSHSHSSSPMKGQDCEDVFCSEPLTVTPIGSPCGCVLPIRVVIDLGVAPYLLFTHIADFEVEVAAGTYLKQSQVKIMAAIASSQDPGKTRVTVYLVPLGEKFDTTTALLIYERLWQKKVPIDLSVFGGYEVIYVHYPGLPSPPSSPDGSPDFGPSASGNHRFPFTADVPSHNTQKMNAGIISVIAISSFILILVCLGIILFMLKWKKLKEASAPLGPATAPSLTKRSGIGSIMSNSMARSTSASFISIVAACPPSVNTFSISELEKATENFSQNKVLGEGGFGRVYHGLLEDGSEVAVKLLTREDHNVNREFIAEVEMLSRLHHRNLVKLIGICIEGNMRCLVYELVRNGSVESHLHGADKKKGSLDWDARMKIALGAARALAYLHEDSNPHVIHRDFKASNVLLDDDFTPKVTDFGLAREASEGIHHISTRVMGTFGYVAPEYAMTGHLVVKSDVYSYGVVLLELLSGRKPVYMSESHGPENLVTWARPLLTSREGVEQLVDPSLRENCILDDVTRVAAIASMCVHIDPSQRPFMGEVVQALKLIYKDNDGTLDDSRSRKESSSGVDYDYQGDFDVESSCWRNGASPLSPYRHGSELMTMEYSSDPLEELERPHSTSRMGGGVQDLTRHNSCGPPRTRKNKTSFYRLRRSISENDHLSQRLGFHESSL